MQRAIVPGASTGRADLPLGTARRRGRRGGRRRGRRGARASSPRLPHVSSPAGAYRHRTGILTPNLIPTPGTTHSSLSSVWSTSSSSPSSSSYPPGLSPTNTTHKAAVPPLLRLLATLLRLPPELLKRIVVTLMMLMATRVGHYIALPAVAAQTEVSLTSLAGSITQTAASEIPNNIYLLSITPYMTASLTLAALQLVPEIRRHIESLREEGRSGRETINGYQNVLFVVSAVIQSVSYAFYQLSSELTGSFWVKMNTAITLMAGAVRGLCDRVIV